MTLVGYMEGVEPLLLSRLAVEGVGTLPVSNGFDNHGKFINNLNERDAVDVIIGHLHKFLATQRHGFLVQDLLSACRACGIPVLVIVPKGYQAAAFQTLDKVADVVRVTDPDDLYEQIAQILHLA